MVYPSLFFGLDLLSDLGLDSGLVSLLDSLLDSDLELSVVLESEEAAFL